jgi:hypothetical protein
MNKGREHVGLTASLVSQFFSRKTLTCPSAKQSTTIVGKNLLPTTKFYPMPNFPSAKSGWGKLGDTYG